MMESILWSYESRKINAAEQNYSMHERGLLVVIHALRTWRHYFLGKTFTIVSDHQFVENIYIHSLSYHGDRPAGSN